MKLHKPQLVHEQRILMLALVSGAPAVLTCMLMLWLGDHTPKVQWTLTVVIVAFWLGFCFGLRERVASPLRTLANLLEAHRLSTQMSEGRVIERQIIERELRAVA